MNVLSAARPSDAFMDFDISDDLGGQSGSGISPAHSYIQGHVYNMLKDMYMCIAALGCHTDGKAPASCSWYTEQTM